MRRLAGAAIVLLCGGAATAACAADALSAWTLPGIATSPPAVGPDDDGVANLLAKAAPLTDAAPVDWRDGEVRFAPQTTLHIRVGDPLAAGGHALQPPGFSGAQAYEFSVVRDWPGAVSFNTQHFGVDFTPHAGFGMTSYGGVAEAGATLQVSQRVGDKVKARLKAMGVGDGTKFGDRGRWYLFAAASGRSVGLNMLRGDSGWSRAGWTTDQTSTLVGDAQVGVGWRKGDMQTSLGFVHREMKGLHNLYGVDDPKADSMVAFTFAVRPQR
jgi:hypothetical protein